MNMRLLSAVLLAGSIVTTACAGIDLNANSYDDVWEQFYEAGSLAPAADEDGDGRSNLQESLAGTDPRNASSAFRITAVEPGAGTVVLRWPSVLGKRYFLQSSSDLATWTDATSLLTSKPFQEPAQRRKTQQKKLDQSVHPFCG